MFKLVTFTVMVAAIISSSQGLATEWGKQMSWLQLAQDSVKERLKDPGSVVFRKMFFSDSGGVPMACGEFNSKNGFGGMAGFQRFASAGSAKMTFMESEVTDFDTAWFKLCASHTGATIP